MIAAVLFDLDDTLYVELDFARSGMAAVAAALADRGLVDVGVARAALDRALAREPRGRTIDAALAELGLATDPALIAALVATYRGHRPTLELAPDAAPVLDRLRDDGVRLGLVTDGDPAVQRGKALALGLDRWMPRAHQRFTWDEGPERQKPHPRAYLGALEPMGVRPADAVYVGDNPTKDFVGARALGMGTVRIRRGAHRDVVAGPGQAADLDVDGLGELPEILAAPPWVR